MASSSKHPDAVVFDLVRCHLRLKTMLDGWRIAKDVRVR